MDTEGGDRGVAALSRGGRTIHRVKALVVRCGSYSTVG